MKTTLLSGWTLMRFFRFGFGLAGVIAAIVNKDMLLGTAGAFLLLLAIANVGCCGVTGCSVNGSSPKPGNIPAEPGSAPPDPKA